MIKALHVGREAAQAIETAATLAVVERLAKRFGLQEIGLLEIIHRRQRRGVLGLDLAGSGGENFIRQADFDNVAGFAALNQAQNTLA